MLNFECAQDCKLGDKCKNRKFTRRQYANFTRFKTSWGGYGLKAKSLIKQGTFVIEYVGELITPNESRRRLEESAKVGVTNYYILSLDKV